MSNQMKFVCILFTGLVFCLFTQATFAQDATKVDSTHYKVEFENDQLRIIRVIYAPGEKSNMHEHSGGVAVFLTDVHAIVSLPDGTIQEVTGRSGETLWSPPVKHQIENISDKPYEGVFIEIKSKPATTKN